MSYQMIGGDTNNLDAVVGQINQNIAQLKVDEQTKIVKDDTGTRRVLLGKGSDGFYGLKVSQADNDVFTVDDSGLVFNSNNNLFKIVRKVELTVSFLAPTTQGTTTYAHGLSSTPAFLAFVGTGSFYGGCPWTLFGTTAGMITYDVYATSTDIVARVTKETNDSNDTQVEFTVYILQETAN